MKMRLALGTVQLGLPYGIANLKGQPSPEESREIIKISLENGLRIFDTAQSYGQSETVLGVCFKSLGVTNEVKVITKLHPDLDYMDWLKLKDCVLNSLKRLNVPSLYGLLLHRFHILDDWSTGLGMYLSRLKEEKLVKYIGVSVYSSDQAKRALAIDGLDLVQVPFNLFDQGLLSDEVLDYALQLKKQIFLRSLFLQGLLLLSPETLPAHISWASPWLKSLESFCHQYGLTKKEFAFKYAWQKTGQAVLLTGVDSVKQIMENLSLMYKKDLDNHILEHWDSFSSDLQIPEKLINPSLWGA